MLACHEALMLLVFYEQACLYRATHIWQRVGRMPRSPPAFHLTLQDNIRYFWLSFGLLASQVIPAFYMEAKFPFQVLLLWQLCGIGATISLFLTDLGFFFFFAFFDCQNLIRSLLVAIKLLELARTLGLNIFDTDPWQLCDIISQLPYSACRS